MMSILYSWKEGLTLLLPRNLKLFALVTLKSIIECYKVYFKYFWWIPVITFLHAYAYQYWLNYTPLEQYNIQGVQYIIASIVLSVYVPLFIYSFNTFVVWLSIRPSIGPKNCAYFRSMIIKYFPAFIVLFLIGSVLTIEVSLYYQSRMFNLLMEPYNIWKLLVLFFVTDTQSSLSNFFKSCWRALLMTIYNLPLLIFIRLLIGLCILPFFIIIRPDIFTIPEPIILKIMEPSWSSSLLMIILDPPTVCILANIYIKRVYEQNSLYFKS